MHPEEIAFFKKHRQDFSMMLGQNFPDVNFTMTIEEGPLLINGVELQVYHTPGHSPGSICIYWPEKKTLVAGDVIFEQSFGRTDFPGGDSRKLIASIHKLSELDIECLLPGHMNMIMGEYAIKKNFEQVEQYFGMLG
jgi:glyoxylase-like metal-dependent hydrolase (beta-lactamase superfamily II)